MKVIFLDMDGVINSIAYWKQRNVVASHRSVFDRHLDEIDPVALSRLNTLVEKSDAKLVLSSSWRETHSCKEIELMFLEIGWRQTTVPFIGATPYLRGKRGEEVDHWLERNTSVKQYVILDDDSDFTSEQKESHFVHTSWETGLLDEHVEKAIQILNT